MTPLYPGIKQLVDFTSDLSFSLSHWKGTHEEESLERYHLQKKLVYHLFEVNECSSMVGDTRKTKTFNILFTKGLLFVTQINLSINVYYEVRVRL